MKYLLFIVFSLFSVSIYADGSTSSIETIELRHRLATEVLSDIQAFLPEESTARAFQNLIIIKADPDTVDEIRNLVQQLDQPLQRIKITVVKTDQIFNDQQETQASVGVEVEDGDVSANAQVSHWSTKGNRDKDQHFKAQGIAGNPITISMGQDVPQHEQLIFVGTHGDMAVETSTSYISLDNGFQAVARLLADQRVHVDIHPFFANLSRRNGTIEQSQIITTLVGPVGQWLELGHITDEENIENSGVTRYSSHQSQQQRLYLKVEPISLN